jgi:hypothetical protein
MHLLWTSHTKATYSYLQARLMQHMKRSSEKQRTHVDEDELIALNAWRRIGRQTREAIKKKFLPDLLQIYEVLPSLL